MKKNKHVALLSATAMGTLIATALSTTAYAKPDAYLTKDKDGKFYEYSIEKLLSSYADELITGTSDGLYENYTNKELVAIHDDKQNAYVSMDKIYEQMVIQEETFDLTNYTEVASKEDQMSKPENVSEVVVEDGKVVVKPNKEVSGELKVESVSAITKTEVTVKLTNAVKEVVADKFQVKANGADVKVEKAENVASDLTGKTYKLTVATLSNQEGKLTVNGVEKDFDFKAPEVLSVVAKGTKSVEITFNEKLDPAVANIVSANFKVVKPGAEEINTTSATLDATGTKVLLVLNTDMTVADYVLKLGSAGPVDVKDVAGNGIYNGTEVTFRTKADDLKVKEAASITTAEYNNGNGELVLSFNKNVAEGDVNLSKLTIGGVEIPTDSVKAQSGDHGVKITLAGDAKKAVDAISGEINLVGAKDAWKDAEFATKGQTIVVSKVSPAVIKSAAYNQETKVLTVNFDQPVKDLVLANIKVNDSQVAKEATAADATNADGTALDTAKAKTTWELKLKDSEAKKLEAEENNKKELKIYMAAAAVKNDNKKDIPSVPTTYADGGVEVKYTADETKPYLLKAEYFNQLGADDKNVLKLTFNESLEFEVANKANIKKAGAVKIAISANGDVVDLSAVADGDMKLDTTGKILTVKFGDAEGKKVDTQYLSEKPIKVWFDKEVLQDKNGLKSEAITFEKGMEVTYKDFIAPHISDVDSLNESYVKVEFNESLDKASAEDIKNYTIEDERDKELKIISAQVQSDRKTVYLKTEKQEFGRPYELKVENIRDRQLNSIGHAGSWEKFYGKGNKVEGTLELDSVVGDAPVNSNNDTLKVTFKGLVNQAEALNLVNYAVLESGTLKDAKPDWTANDVKAVSLEGAKAEIDATGKVVTITLGKANLQNGKFYRLAVSNMKDVYGNKLTGKTTVDSKVLAVAGDLAKPTVVEGNTKENAVKLTFTEELNKTEAEKVTNYKIDGNDITKAVYAWNAEKKEATVALDVKTAITNEAGVDVLVHRNVTNLAGKGMADGEYNAEVVDGKNTMATIAAPESLIDTVAPSIDKVEAKIVENAKNDVITVIFKDKDILSASANVADNYVVKDSKGNVIAADTYEVKFAEGNDEVDTVTLTFNKADKKAYNLQSAEEYSIVIKGVMDTSGNKLGETAKKISWAADSDKDAPKINNVDVKANDCIEVTLSEEVNKEDAKNLVNYVVELNDTKLTPIMAEYDEATKKVNLYVKEELKAADENNHYKVTVKNVKDLAGNVDAKGSSKQLPEAVAGGGHGAGVVFAASTNSDTANDAGTLGVVGTTATSADNTVVDSEIEGGKIKITSKKAGKTTISVKDATGKEAIIEVTVDANGTITVGKITKAVKFESKTNNDTANDAGTLGVVGTTATSADNTVVDSEIEGGKIKITSKKAGKTTISVKDATGKEATIEVTVDANGTITVGTITQAN